MKPLEIKAMDKTLDTLALIGNGIILAAAAVMAFTGLPAEALTVFAVLMLVDYFSGIGSAVAVGTPITSRKMKVGVISKIITFLIPLVLAATLKVTIGVGNATVVSFALSILIIAEAYSIISNLHAIKTGKYLPEFEVIALIGEKLRGIINKKLDIGE